MAVLLVSTGYIRLAGETSSQLSTGLSLLLFIVYGSMIIAWGLSLYRRMIHSHIRNYLMGIAACMLFWIFLHTIRYSAFFYLDHLSRLLWYAYYIAPIFISLLSFFAATCLGEAEEWRPHKKFYLLFIPATVLPLLFLSNDLHQWAFSFPQGLSQWSRHDRYGFVYYLAIAWIAGCMTASLCSLYQKSHIPHTRKRIWLPSSMIGTGFLYAVLYATGKAKMHYVLIEMTVCYCVLTAAIWESFIRIKLLPSNIRYGDFFQSSDLAVLITDQQGVIQFQSRQARPLAPARFQQLCDQKSVQLDPHALLHAVPIRGGYVIWREDIAALSRLITSLQEAEEELKEGVGLIEKEIETKSRRLRVDEQNRLYRLTVEQTMPQLEQIKSLLATLRTASQAERRQGLIEICLLGTYIKRRSHLVLLSESQERAEMAELARCFMESLRALEEYGVACQLTWPHASQMHVVHMIEWYDFFQTRIQASLPKLQRIVVEAIEESGLLQLYLSLTATEHKINAGVSAPMSASRNVQQFRLEVPQGSV